MARFSSEEKIQAVRQYIDGNEGGQTIAKSIGVHPSLLHQWIKQFALFGDDAFEKRYTPYPAQFKLTYSLISTMLDQAFERLTDDDTLLIHQIKAGTIK